MDLPVNALGFRRNLLQGICLAALSAGVVTPASAQEKPVPAAEDAAASEDIIITGMRENLAVSLSNKRYADTVIDSVSAKDIGSFPDKSVAEALQRIPGITVNRFAGSNDTAHFSAEPSGVIVRGLNQVRSEFNGRDVFSANSSRGLSWQDISPELLGGIDVYKNQTADLIEGGIAGTVNLKTRLPFDTEGQLISASIKASYGDRAGELTPEFSGIYSNRFETGIGEIGFMVNGAYSQVVTSSHGVQFDRMAVFDGVFGPGKQYIPTGISMRDNEYDRRRYGVSAAFQWQSTDESMLLTAQYNRSQYNNSWREYMIMSSAFNIYGQPSDRLQTDPTLVNPLKGTPAFTFDDDGNFLSGWWSSPAGWVGAGDENKGLGVNAAGDAFFNRCYSWEGCNNSQRAPSLDTASNALRNRQMTQDIGINFKWNATERLRLNFDGQYVDATVNNYNAAVQTRTYANTYVDLTGKYPRLEINPNVADNINLSPGGVTNANNYFVYSASDHTEDSEGRQWAFRADAEYDVGTSWLDSIKVGARYADRDQTVRWGAYNWANISNTWNYNQASFFNFDKPIYSGSNVNHTFRDNFFAGNQLAQQGFQFFDMRRLEQREQLAATLGRPTIGVGDFYPVCSNAGPRAGEVEEHKFGCYLPSEIHKVNERTVAAYAVAKFGGPDLAIGGVPVSGNVGVRLVWTRNSTDGFATYPLPFTATDRICERGTDPVTLLPTATTGCVISAREVAFNNGATVDGTTEINHFNPLPSFNLKLDWTDKLLTRVAYSRAMSRPDIGLLRNFLTVSRISPNLNDRTDPNITFDAQGRPIAYKWQYTGNSGNPGLKPITADQFDVTMEYYFSPTGAFTATGFYKKFHDYIQNGSFLQSVVNNGITEEVRVQRPMNGSGASIYGAELSFQTFFDFLPGALSGLGIQTNYTYVHNNGIQAVALTNETAGGSTGGGLAYDTTAVRANALEGISKHSFNLVGMYEKGQISARVAYNWRSQFLVSAIDCCVGLPIWQQDVGYLDATVRWRAAKWFEFVLEGTNLLNTDTVLYQQVDNEGTLKPASWFRNDRRFQFGVRATF